MEDLISLWRSKLSNLPFSLFFTTHSNLTCHLSSPFLIPFILHITQLLGLTFIMQILCNRERKVGSRGKPPPLKVSESLLRPQLTWPSTGSSSTSSRGFWRLFSPSSQYSRAFTRRNKDTEERQKPHTHGGFLKYGLQINSSVFLVQLHCLQNLF